MILFGIILLIFLSLLKSLDVEIVISTDDVTTKDGCEKLILKACELGPIGGIFNLAGVLLDSIFANQSTKTFRKTLEPKATATKNLHEQSLKHCPDLMHFVVFSSIACSRGGAGQTNYGMSNSAMEQIVEMRHQMGLPAKAIQWGEIK